MYSDATLCLTENPNAIPRVGPDHARALTCRAEALDSVMSFANAYDTDAGRVMTDYASMVYRLSVPLYTIVTLADTMDTDTGGIVDTNYSRITWARRKTLNTVIIGRSCVTLHAGFSSNG